MRNSATDILALSRVTVPVLKNFPKASVAFRLKECIMQSPLLPLLVRALGARQQSVVGIEAEQSLFPHEQEFEE